MTRSATFATRSALILSLVSLTTMSPATASTVLPAPSPAPAPAPSGGVAGPPDGMIAPPPPQGQRPFPSIGTFPTPAPGPTVRPSQPQPPQATPAPRPAPAPRAGAARPPAVGPTAAPGGIPAPAPATTADPLPAPAVPLPTVPVVDAVPADTPPPVTVPVERQWPEWLPLAAFGGAAVLLGGGWLWSRRRRTLALPAPEQVERSVSPPPPRPKPTMQPSPRPAPAPTALGRRADLEIAFEALSAQSTLMNLRIRYAITVRNSGQIAAEQVTVRIGLFAGSQVHPQGIAQWFALEGQPLHHGVEAVPAGSDYRFEGELAAPLDALNPVTIDGRVLAIPLVAIDARYGHGEGEAPIEGQSARAFVIGRDPQREGAKLAPFRLDQGPTSFAPLGQRDAGISKVA